jgi:hypothetical protein
MTARRRRTATPARTAERAARLAGLAVSRDDFPRVAEFLRGYLHQDFLVDHGSPRAALDAYLGDIDPIARRAFALEAARLGDALSTLPLGVVRRTLAEVFGCAWSPETPAEVHALLRVRSEA